MTRESHAGGNALFQQIELDMHRLAAIYTVERFKPRLMPYFLMLMSKPGSISRLKSGFLRRHAFLPSLPSVSDGFPTACYSWMPFQPFHLVKNGKACSSKTQIFLEQARQSAGYAALHG